MRFLARLLAAVLFFTLAVDASAAEAATKPSAPRSVKATPSNHAVKVSWSAPSSNGGAAIDKYAVQRWTGTKWITVKTTNGRARSWTNTGLTNGEKYYFLVFAHNRLGWSKTSARVSATPRTVPSAPYKFQADLHPSGLGARWEPSKSNGGAAIDFYLVEVSTDGVAWTTPKKSTTYGTSVNPILFSGLVPGGRYWLRARAHNAAGYSASTGSGPYKVYLPPLAVRDLEAESSSGQIALTWRAPLSDTETGLEDGLPAAAAYQVETSIDGGPWSAPVARTVPSYTATSLVNGSEYAFRVTAKGVSKIGLGAPTVITPDVPTDVPTVPTSVALNWRLPEAKNMLTWAPPDNDGGLEITSYVVEYWTTSTPDPRPTFTFDGDVFAGLADVLALDHTFHVKACNALGCSPWSADIGPIPGFVTNASIDAAGSTVSLDWDPPANDAVAVNDYSIARSTDGGTTWSPLGTTAETTYEDATAAFATSYKYRIIANGTDGSGGWAALDVTTDPYELGVSTTAITISESGNDTFQVTLAPVVTDGTQITVTSADPSSATPASPTVTIPAGQTSADVTIDGVADLDLVNETVVITLQYGTQTEQVTVTVNDDDTQAFVLSDDTATLTEGGQQLIDVKLAFQPAGNVTVFVSSDNTDAATVSPSTLTFTPSNWSTVQSVTITALAAGSATVAMSSPGAATEDVDVTVNEP